jgi:hypothetical protein
MKIPRTNFIHLCETAITSREGLLSIINILQTVNTAKLPAVIPKLSVVTSLTVNATTKLKIQMVHKASGEVIAKGEPELNMKEDKASEINFVTQFNNLKFEKEGEHHLEIWANGEILDTAPFHIRVVSPQTPPAK